MWFENDWYSEIIVKPILARYEKYEYKFRHIRCVMSLKCAHRNLRWHVTRATGGESKMRREKRDRWAFLTTLSYSSQFLSRAIPPIKLSSWIFYKSIQVIQPSTNDASSRTLFCGFSCSRTVRSLPYLWFTSPYPRRDDDTHADLDIHDLSCKPSSYIKLD